MMRNRATAIVYRDGKVLLVRDKGKHRFSLPGGAIKKDEPAISAAAREVFEELALNPIMARRLREYDFTGSVNEHKVCMLEVKGEPHLNGHELDAFIWWDMKQHISVYEYVTSILNKVKFPLQQD